MHSIVNNLYTPIKVLQGKDMHWEESLYYSPYVLISQSCKLGHNNTILVTREALKPIFLLRDHVIICHFFAYWPSKQCENNELNSLNCRFDLNQIRREFFKLGCSKIQGWSRLLSQHKLDSQLIRSYTLLTDFFQFFSQAHYEHFLKLHYEHVLRWEMAFYEQCCSVFLEQSLYCYNPCAIQYSFGELMAI